MKFVYVCVDESLLTKRGTSVFIKDSVRNFYSKMLKQFYSMTLCAQLYCLMLNYILGYHSIITTYVETRKPSWRKGKCVTAVRVWRPVAKKSKLINAIQRLRFNFLILALYKFTYLLTYLPSIDILQLISDFLLMVNSNRGHITYRLRDIFAYRGWNRHFSPLYFDCRPRTEERPAISFYRFYTVHIQSLF